MEGIILISSISYIDMTLMIVYMYMISLSHSIKFFPCLVYLILQSHLFETVVDFALN